MMWQQQQSLEAATLDCSVALSVAHDKMFGCVPQHFILIGSKPVRCFVQTWCGPHTADPVSAMVASHSMLMWNSMHAVLGGGAWACALRILAAVAVVAVVETCR